MVNTLVDNDVRHRSGKNCYNILTTLITNIVVDKSRDHAENLSICLIEHLFMYINGLN